MRRTLLLGAVLVVVTLAAGWWQLRDADRIASIDGIASAEYKPGYWYEVTLEPGLSTGQIRDVLAEISASVEAAEDRDGLPMMWAAVGPAEFTIDISDDFDRTAAIISATTTTDLAGAEVDLTGDSPSQFIFEARDDVLSGAQHLVSGLGLAGVNDLAPMGEAVEFYYTHSNTYGPTIELDTMSTNVTLRQLDSLARLLRRSGADLIQADRSDGNLIIDVAIPGGSQADPVARVFNAAYGKRHLDLTVTSQAR